MMKSVFRGVLQAAVALGLAAAAPILAAPGAVAPVQVAAAVPIPAAMPVLATAAAPLPIRPGVWAQDYVGRRADPAVRFGTLPNGMRYAVMHNATPPGQMSMRLLIGAGSMAETDSQRGLAHFLEHMAFRGSKGVPDGEMIRILQRKGVSPGADSNAATDFETTSYRLDLPQSDADSIATSLKLLRAIASDLTIAPAAVDAERGVVLSEERTRDGPGLHAQEALIGFQLQGQLATRRLPIGTRDILASATAADIRAYYTAHYRPDNAVVIAVGDFNAAAVEAQLKAQFASWAKPTAPIPVVDTGTVAARGEGVQIFAEAGAPPFLQIAWLRPFETDADTSAHERRDLLRIIAQSIFNQRLQDIARGATPPFTGAQFGRSNVLQSANATTLSVANVPAGRGAALTALIAEQRRALRDGFTQAELARIMGSLRTLFAASAARAESRTTPALAAGLLGAANNGSVFTSPAQDSATFAALAPTITLAEINATFADAFTGAGLLFQSAAGQPAGGYAALRAEFDAARAADPGQEAATTDMPWPYTGFGTPGAVAARTTIADLGVFTVTFANGTRLNVKPTDFTRDSVFVRVEFGTGRAGLPAALSQAWWIAGSAALVEGGLGKLTSSETQRLLSDKLVSIGLGIEDRAFTLTAATRPQDLPVQMQLLAAQMTDPGYRAEAVTRIKSMTATALPQVDSNPQAVLSRVLGPALHGGDMRWAAVPSADDIANTSVDDLKAMLAPALNDGPLEITMVGDTDVDTAIAAVAATFGALPPRPALPPVVGGADLAAIHLPAPTPRRRIAIHRGRADQAIAFESWPGTGFFENPHDARALSVAMAVVQSRLYDSLREADGLTYSPQAGSSASTDIPGYGVISVAAEIAPDKIDIFEARLAAIIANLQAKTVPADELARIRTPLVESRRRNLKENAFWLGALSSIQRQPADLDAIRTRVSDVEAVTAADIQRVARLYLAPAKAWRLIVRSEAALPVIPVPAVPAPVAPAPALR
jgi:zinc protease